jgi:ankyrin repeat protein
MPDLAELAAQGDIAGVTALLDAGADIDQRGAGGQTAAMAATYANNVELARLLFARGADPDIQDDILNTPFLYAGAEGYLEILMLANEAGADPAILNRYGGTALIPASEHGYVEVVTYLLEQTAVEVNHVNNLGWTALLEAIILNDGGPRQQETIRVLIAHGADVAIADADGVTPLEHARQRGFREIAAILVQAGAQGPRTVRGRGRIEP